ncbi:hypothetical protein KL3_00025 [Klebsiella phage KL3]|nr:hypothetical protein KL3_00025 [Klebsiella phage KL3]
MQGMQAWDENGNIVVDIGDFSTRFVGRYRIHIPQGGNDVYQHIPGINGTNSFASIMFTSGYLGGMIDPEYIAVTGNNGFKVIYLPQKSSRAIDIDVEVYSFF